MVGSLIILGKDMLNLSNRDRPNTIIMTPANIEVMGCVLIAPRNLPVREAINPNKEYIIATPVTYIKLKTNPLILEPAALTPMKPTLMGISGYTQGVKLKSTPPKNATK